MAISCSLNKDLTKKESCGYVLQSVATIYLANAADVTFVTNEGDTYDVTGVTLAEEAKWYRIEPAKNTASFNDTLNVTDSGNKYRTHSLSFSVMGTYSPDMQEALDQLSLGSYVALAVFASGDGVLLGTPDAGLEASTVTNAGSASATEASGISVEMSRDLTNSAYAFTKEEIDAMVK
jgi:hypothetical protein